MARDLENRLVSRLVFGLGGWLSYVQAKRASSQLDEYDYYLPIWEIARGQKWRVERQLQILKSTPRRGSNSTIDFGIYRRPGEERSKPGFALIEVKLLRGENVTSEPQGLIDDANKLAPLKSVNLSDSSRFDGCPEPAKYLVVIAQKEALDKLSGANSSQHSGVRNLLGDVANSNPGTHIYHAYTESHIKDPFRWHVFSIGETRWNDLRA